MNNVLNSLQKLKTSWINTKTLEYIYGVLTQRCLIQLCSHQYNSDELLDYQLGSGGGTEFECNWDYMKEQGIEPKKFVMFTDGWPFQ